MIFQGTLLAEPVSGCLAYPLVEPSGSSPFSIVRIDCNSTDRHRHFSWAPITALSPTRALSSGRQAQLSSWGLTSCLPGALASPVAYPVAPCSGKYSGNHFGNHLLNHFALPGRTTTSVRLPSTATRRCAASTSVLSRAPENAPDGALEGKERSYAVRAVNASAVTVREAERRSAATPERVTEEVSAMPTTGQVSAERSEVRNAARCHLPLCSFLYLRASGALAEDRGHFLPLHQGKRVGHLPIGQRRNPKDPKGGVDQWTPFCPGKSGIALTHGLERSGTVGQCFERSEVEGGGARGTTLFPSPTRPRARGCFHPR